MKGRMDDLMAFLRARFDEDAADARAATPGPWHADGGSVYATHPTDEVVTYTESADHIARHDPARVLAEVDAKRRLLARHVPERRRLTLIDEEGGTTSFGFHVCTACTPNRTIEQGQDIVEWPCPDVRALALPYASHPDHSDKWRP